MCNSEMKRGFKRVQFKNLKKMGGLTVEELANEVMKHAQEDGNSLVILNTKNSAKKLYEIIKERYSDILNKKGFSIYVLTTKLYPLARKNKVAEIKAKLLKNENIIVISTQLIEAGVDVSFHNVFRSYAGLDSIIQSAGRCNRHGKDKKSGTVFLINTNFENLDSLTDIQAGKITLENLLT